MSTATTSTLRNPHPENFRRAVRGIAHARRKCARAKSSPPKSCASTTTSSSSTPASSPKAYIPIEEFKNDKGEVEVKAGDFVSVAIEALEDGYGDTILSRDKAKRLAAWHDLEAALEQGDDRHRHRHRQGQGRPHRHGQRHPRLPAGLAGRHPPGQGHDARSRARRSSSRSSSSTASATTSWCRAAPCSKRAMGEERAEAAGDAAGRRDRQGRGQEHHRLRRVRRPGRHRRPAAHHRPRLAPRASTRRKCCRSATKSPPRSSSSTRRRTASRWA